MRGTTHPSKSFLTSFSEVETRCSESGERPTHEQMDAGCRHRPDGGVDTPTTVRIGARLCGYDVDVHREHVLRDRFAQNPDGWLYQPRSAERVLWWWKR